MHHQNPTAAHGHPFCPIKAHLTLMNRNVTQKRLDLPALKVSKSALVAGGAGAPAGHHPYHPDVAPSQSR
jgi:hypothetical protein